eukprot:510934-Rhodomonas_salina.1
MKWSRGRGHVRITQTTQPLAYPLRILTAVAAGGSTPALHVTAGGEKMRREKKCGGGGSESTGGRTQGERRGEEAEKEGRGRRDDGK